MLRLRHVDTKGKGTKMSITKHCTEGFILAVTESWLKSSEEYRTKYNINSIEDCQCAAEEVAAGYITPAMLEALEQIEFVY